MKNGIPGIDVKTPVQNPTVDSEYSFYELPYFKTDDYFFDVENEVKFIESIERTVRKSKYYKRYIAHLKQDLGLNFCQVKLNISEEEEDEDKPRNKLIEMHHGPLFTLFDVSSIILNKMMIDGEKITTFRVADKVIQEHFNHNVQTIMLSETAHQMVHDRNIFLNLNMAFGDIYSFLDKYMEAIEKEQIVKIQDYIERSKKYESNDFGNLEIFVTEWSRTNPDFIDNENNNNLEI